MAVDTPARIVILGAGPVGIEAGLYARFLGYEVAIYEQGELAEHVRRWGHVRMFTPVRLLRSTLGLAAIQAQEPGYHPPDEEALLSGHEWLDSYLRPLSQTDLLSDAIHTHTQVVAVSRFELLKGEWPRGEDRRDLPFRILLRDSEGREWDDSADAVIDATGVFGTPNWLGQGGAPAIGETFARPHIEYGIPDVLGAQHEEYAGRRVLLVGSPPAVAFTLLGLVELARRAPGTHVTWVTRSPAEEGLPAPIPAALGDPFAERARLIDAANTCAASPPPVLAYWPGTQVESLVPPEGGNPWKVVLRGGHAGAFEFDRVIANVGYRPQSDLFSELQIEQCCYCGRPGRHRQGHAPEAAATPDEGPRSLLQAEPDFYILGAKSFGRRPDFLFHLGLRQVRDLFTILGDREGLDLYESAKSLLR